MSHTNLFSKWYKKTELMENYLRSNQLTANQLRMLAPTPIPDQNPAEAVGGLQGIRVSISWIHHHLNALAQTNTALEQGLNDLAAPMDPAQMIGNEDPARKEEIKGKMSQLESTRGLSQNKLTETRDALRKETLRLSRSLHSRHLHAFFSNEAERQNLINETNRLRRALDTPLFGEGLWERRYNNPSIRDKHWKEVGTYFDHFGPNSAKAKSTENCIILSCDSKNFWRTQQTDIQLNFKEICQSIDFMKNPDFYISLWEEKLQALKGNPLDPELKKYEKYKPLLDHLKFCKQPDQQNPGKTFTGPKAMNLTENLFSKKLSIRCGSPAGKEAMLKTLRLFTQIAREEKPENQKNNVAGFGAELLPSPELGEDDRAPRLGLH